MDLITTITKKHNKTVRSIIKIAPVNASVRNIESIAKNNLKDTRVRRTLKFQIGDLVRRTDKRKVSSRDDTKLWSYKLYTIAEMSNETISTQSTKNIPEKVFEALLRKTTLTKKKNTELMKTLKIYDVKMPLSITTTANQFICLH